MTSLSRRRNLGPTIVRCLEQVGIADVATLRRVGPVQAYRRMAARTDRPLRLCYYLYSLEAALRNVDWRDLTPVDKARLRRAAGR